MKDKLIVALDTDDGEEINWLSGTLMDTVRWFKIGFQAFSTRSEPKFFRGSNKTGHNVFVDLKFHDIPNTVARDVGMMTKHGANMINMHAAGGLEMMKAARDSADAAAYEAQNSETYSARCDGSDEY